MQEVEHRRFIGRAGLWTQAGTRAYSLNHTYITSYQYDMLYGALWPLSLSFSTLYKLQETYMSRGLDIYLNNKNV